jgi:hypothetical protein
MMAKRSCSHEEEGQKPRGLAHLKKKGMIMKKTTTTIAAHVAYTQERTKESKTMGGSIKKQVQAKTKSKTTKMCDDGEKVLHT